MPRSKNVPRSTITTLVMPGAPCTLHPSERSALQKRMWRSLIEGHRPADPSETPHAIFVFGGIGSGKTTVAREFVRQHHPERDYVDLDGDNAIDFHPMGNAIWDTRDVNTGVSAPGVALTNTWGTYSDQVIDDWVAVVMRIVKERKHHIIWHCHSAEPLMLMVAKEFGYRTLLLFVGVQGSVAEDRAVQRARILGRFVPIQAVAASRRRVENVAPWLALLCDEVCLVDNNGPSVTENVERAPVLPVHGPGDWPSRTVTGQILRELRRLGNDEPRWSELNTMTTTARQATMSRQRHRKRRSR